VPGADRAELRRLADLVLHRDAGVFDVPESGMAAALDLVVYYSGMLADRRRRPRGDLTSALAEAEVDGERLTDDEIVGFLFLMVVAGNETTTKLLGNAWYWAWRFPDQQKAALAGEVTPANWAEETLRFDTSSQLLLRVTNAPVELHGTVVPADERVLLLVGSANRDPRAFPEPDRYDLRRDCSGLASFGVGRHFCMGAALARLEARVALEELTKRVASYEIDESRAVRVHSTNVRGFAALPGTLTVR